ncbi:5-methyltetrahydropteroyltriglutamate--homocysteine methyltransferase [Tanacetum coccineum]
MTTVTFDLVRGANTHDLIKSSLPPGKYLFAGVVDGRNSWVNDLVGSLSILESLESIVVEVVALAKALAGQKDEPSRRLCSDHRRATNVSARLDTQQKKLNLPILPTTTIGSFPEPLSSEECVACTRLRIE